MSPPADLPQPSPGGPQTEPVAVSLKEMIEAGGASLINFGHLFLPRMFRSKSPLFHYEIAAGLAGPRRLLAFEVFRDAAKTSLLRAYMLQRIAYCLSNVIMIVSAKAGHSELSIMWLRGMIENNKNLKAAFSLRPGAKWTSDHIEILRPGFEPDDPRAKVHVIAVGLTGQIRGFNIDDFRPDLILLDDGQTEESVGTPEQSEKTSDLTFGALQNSLVPHLENPQAKMVVLQTPMEHGDVIDMVKKSPLWTTYSYSIFDSRGNSRWPERYSTEQLQLEKADAIRMGKYSRWMREKQVTLVKSERKPFDLSRVRIVSALPSLIHDRAAGIDPASSEDKRADNQAVVTALRSGPDIYAVACHAAKGEMPDELCNAFFNQRAEWHPRVVRVEAVHYQRTLAWFMQQEMAKRRQYTTIHKVKGETRNKSDRLIQVLSGITSEGHLIFYAPDGLLSGDMLELYNELLHYEPNSSVLKDDRIDALAMAVEQLDSPFNTDADDGEMTLTQAIAAERREHRKALRDSAEDAVLIGGSP